METREVVALQEARRPVRRCGTYPASATIGVGLLKDDGGRSFAFVDVRFEPIRRRPILLPELGEFAPEGVQMEPVWTTDSRKIFFTGCSESPALPDMTAMTASDDCLPPWPIPTDR
jgi:hypothetical protein